MATIYLFGKKYEVPAELTIMNAMEYAGYQLVRGCGCRNGFCGFPHGFLCSLQDIDPVDFFRTDLADADIQGSGHNLVVYLFTAAFTEFFTVVNPFDERIFRI